MSLILVRHGESLYNFERRHSGQADIGLTKNGRQQTTETGKILATTPFQTVFCSTLQRAIETCANVLDENMTDAPFECYYDGRLNERCDGDLTGMLMTDAIKTYGQENIDRWRKQIYTRPPGGESRYECYNRVIECYKERIKPALKQGNVLVVAHQGSLVSLMVYLDGLPIESLCHLNIDNGEPVIYDI